MKKIIILLLAVFFLLLPAHTFAAGLFLTNGYTQVAPVAFRAALTYDGKTETIIESTTFNLNPLVVWNFIWLIPVPAKPQVELISDDFFNKLEYLTRKNFRKKYPWEKLLYFDISEVNNIPQEPYSRPVNINAADIFEPGQADKFQKWLDDMGFMMPKNAKPAISSYLQNNWYLVALTVNATHLQLNATDSLNTFGGHSLPVKISFDTDKMIYPLKLAGLQPDIDSQAIPLSYGYGTASEDVLGEKDLKVDDLLSVPSGNKFPSLPLDLSNIKIDLFVFGEGKAHLEGFASVYADRVSENTFQFSDALNKFYFQPPTERTFLTRLYAYKTANLLEDLTIEKSNKNTRVNPQITFSENIFRVLTILILMLLIFYTRLSYEKFKKNPD